MRGQSRGNNQVNAIEKGKGKMQDAKSDSLASIAFDSVLLETATSILEQTAIAHANERVIEELEMVSSMLWEKSNYEMDIPGDYVQTDECVEWIDKRIKELQSSH